MNMVSLKNNILKIKCNGCNRLYFPNKIQNIGKINLCKECKPPKKRLNVYQRKWVKYHKRDIPKGSLIHHKDGNHRNNNIKNLQLLTIKQHGRLSKEQMFK